MVHERYIILDNFSRWDISGYDANRIFYTQAYSNLEYATIKDACGYNTGPTCMKIDNYEQLGGIYMAKVYNRKCPLLKTLYTNRCKNDCYYCINTSTHKPVDLSYTPNTLARRFNAMVNAGIVNGLFLSSGLWDDEDRVMEEMLEAVEIIRHRYKYKGYIHLKILPGTDNEYIKRAIELANRVSINLEVPRASYIGDISSTKDYQNDLYNKLKTITSLNRKNKSLRSGVTTQFIVGATEETDAEIFAIMTKLYKDLNLKRVYFSAFTPIKGTKLETRSAESKWREYRLYQLDFLYRFYPFNLRDYKAVFNDNGFLPNTDPKIAIAREYFDKPIDINTASYNEMVRIPGIGPKTAIRIMYARTKKVIKTYRDLKRLGVVITRAMPYIKLNGWYQSKLK